MFASEDAGPTNLLKLLMEALPEGFDARGCFCDDFESAADYIRDDWVPQVLVVGVHASKHKALEELIMLAREKSPRVYIIMVEDTFRAGLRVPWNGNIVINTNLLVSAIADPNYLGDLHAHGYNWVENLDLPIHWKASWEKIRTPDPRVVVPNSGKLVVVSCGKDPQLNNHMLHFVCKSVEKIKQNMPDVFWTAGFHPGEKPNMNAAFEYERSSILSSSHFLRFDGCNTDALMSRADVGICPGATTYGIFLAFCGKATISPGYPGLGEELKSLGNIDGKWFPAECGAMFKCDWTLDGFRSAIDIALREPEAIVWAQQHYFTPPSSWRDEGDDQAKQFASLVSSLVAESQPATV